MRLPLGDLNALFSLPSRETAELHEVMLHAMFTNYPPVNQGSNSFNIPPVMADIFISYAREDRAQAAALAKYLSIDMGLWTVFWDQDLTPGMDWFDRIGEELKVCGCVVVLWSAASVRSPWVLFEARAGRARNILLPAQLDHGKPPLEFGNLHTAQLQNWNGLTNLEVAMLGSAIMDLVGVTPPSLIRNPSADAIAKDEHFRTAYPNVQLVMILGLQRNVFRAFATMLGQDFAQALRRADANPAKTLLHLQKAIRAYFDQKPNEVFPPQSVDALRARFLACQSPDDFYALRNQLEREYPQPQW